MKSGGYKVIDLKNIPLSNFAVNIPGIYEQIEASNKLCVVSGLYAGGVEYDDVAVLFTGGSTFTAKITDTLTLSVKDNDNVTVIVTTVVEPMKYIDGKAFIVPANGIVSDVNIFTRLLNLFSKKEPFYFKDLDLSKLNGLENVPEAAHITVMPFFTTTDGYNYGGIFLPTDSVSYIRFKIDPVYFQIKFELVTGG